jgi:hypothetical protein
MESIQLPVLTYVLNLENNKYYVGKTFNLNLRVAQHMEARGARWTKLHKPVGIYKVLVGDVERQTTLDVMTEMGWENVRGGGWCQVDMKYPPKALNNS